MSCQMKSATTKKKEKPMRKFLTLLIFLVLALPLSAQDFLPNKPVGMVNDFAKMLSSSEEQQLEKKLRSYRDSTTNVIAIATLESLEGYSEEEIATTLFNNWRMWEGERYNGVLILVSEQDRRMQIEVGYGLEGAIPDAMANRVYADILVPSFQAGDFYGGLDQATNVLMELAAGEFEGFPEQQSSAEGFPIDVLIIFIIIIFILISRGKSKGGRRHSLGSGGIIFYGGGFGSGGGGGSSFGGGGGFGGFSGGGGFGSGGGGAGGGW